MLTKTTQRVVPLEELAENGRCEAGPAGGGCDMEPSVPDDPHGGIVMPARYLFSPASLARLLLFDPL